MIHHTCCCGAPDLCDEFNPLTEKLCFNLNFSGINKNPWVLTDDNCTDGCPFQIWPGSGSLNTYEIVTLAGVNGTFSYHSGASGAHPALAVRRQINSSCDGYLDSPFQTLSASSMVVSAAASCVDGVLTLTSVQIQFQASHSDNDFGATVFEWVGSQAVIGTTVTVPNQLEACFLNVFDGMSGSFASGGECEVTISIVPSADPSPCTATTKHAIAEKCSDSSVQIVVDLSTNTTNKKSPKLGADLYHLTGSMSTGTPVAVSWVDDLCTVAPPPAPLMAPSGFRSTGLSSDQQIDAMGGSPEQESAKLKQGGCCDPPRAID